MAGLNIRVGECYESSLVTAIISLCTLFKRKSVKKVFKSTATGSELDFKLYYYESPYDQGLLTEVPLNFEIFVIKAVGQTMQAYSTTKMSKL